MLRLTAYVLKGLKKKKKEKLVYNLLLPALKEFAAVCQKTLHFSAVAILFLILGLAVNFHQPLLVANDQKGFISGLMVSDTYLALHCRSLREYNSQLKKYLMTSHFFMKAIVSIFF